MVSPNQSLPSVHVHVLDNQHEVLFESIERLEKAMADGQSTAELPQIINALYTYASQHGPTEERLMTAYAYPWRDVHTIEHQKFFTRLREVERMVGEGHSTAAIQTLSRLRGWLEKHIEEWDTKLGDFLNSRGID